MRSESLMRFGDAANRASANEDTRAEVARQTEEFLSRGGKIEVLPGFGEVGRRRDDIVRDMISGRIVSRPQREMLDGRAIVRIAAVCKLTKRSTWYIRKASRHDVRFPQPVPGVTPFAWYESDILAWAAECLT